MKAKKAIEILELYIPDPDSVPVSDSIDAIRLGVEALKLIEYCRRGHFIEAVKLLPRETPEDV